RSGHVYFTLKDSNAQLRCALFRHEAVRVAFPLADGLQVLARGRVSIYPARGEFQLYVTELEEAGLGALQRAFEALKKKLADEGLFDPSLKRPLPRYPRRIGVITSPTGAALRDILNVLGRRYPAADVLIYPTQVQGDAATGQIVAALERAGRRRDCDVLILARGGGSLEDLWCFNEESVARAIRACAVPVITGVGHETDFTISDFAADLRAPTPSVAAETVTPDGAELLARLGHFEDRFAHAWRRGDRERRHGIAGLARRLEVQHPRRHLQERAQRLDELAARLAAALPRSLAARRARLATLRSELARHSPFARVTRLQSQFSQLRKSLIHAGTLGFERRRQALRLLASQLQSLGPDQTLARGYAIVFDDRGDILRDVRNVRVGARVRARLAGGAFAARVETTEAGTR
ncbi:MAG: exodeoxyribonuclease VII large subunit, partial [Gammaproteobacteria bacterium]